MRRGNRRLIAAVLAVTATALLVSSVGAALGEGVRANGVVLALPEGWQRVLPVRDDRTADPRTLLVIGWRDSVGGSVFLPLSGLKLRRGTFECFAGRGAVARLTRRERDFQVNVLVGDRADAATIADAFEAARSFAIVPRG